MKSPASEIRSRSRLDAGRVARRLWTAAWLALVTGVSVVYLLPGAAPPGEYQVDKLLHVAAFAAIGFPLRFMAGDRAAFLTWVVVSFAISITLETLQSFIPGRIYSNADMAANLVGVAVGIAAAAAVGRYSGTP